MKIIVATGNEDKVGEIREILGDFPATVVTMRQAGLFKDVDETGTTFAENAAQKATAIAQAAAESEEWKDAVVMSDDSGLVVDALGGEPGIYSARYLGKETPYPTKNALILDRMADVPEAERTARFVCAVAAVLPGGELLMEEATMEGIIGYEIKGENGFGYDPIFFLPDWGKTSAELTHEEKNGISHRGKAMTAMLARLSKLNL